MTRLRTNPWAVLLVLCTGFFMILLDTTIVNVAIPSIIDALNASLDQIIWVLNAYILVYAVLLITAGRLGDLYGQRNMFAGGMALFILASALAGQAHDVNQLIAARVLQGVGGAILTPQTMAMITTIFPPEKRGAAFGVWGAVAGIAAIAGPTLGGFIVTTIDWRWIFYVNLPIGVLSLIATFLILPDLRPGRRHSLDIGGVLLTMGGLFLIVFGLIEGQQFAWGTVWGFLSIPEIILAGVALMGAFFLWERNQKEPLLPFSLFKDRNYLLMNWIAAVVAFGMLGMFLPLTIYLQSALGMTALQAGLTVAPMSLVSMIVAPFSGRIVDRFGGKYILMFGMAIYGLAMGSVAWMAGTTSTATTFLPSFVLAGLGQGMVFAPMTTVAMRDITPRMAGAASGVLNTTRQMGGVMGSAIVGAVLQNQLDSSLRIRAVADAAQLPPQYQQPFIQGFSNAAKSGLEVGAGQTGTHLPAGLPPETVQQIGQLAHDVFVNGFVIAMRPTMGVSVAVLLLGALTCLAVIQRGRQAEQPVTSVESYARWSRPESSRSASR